MGLILKHKLIVLVIIIQLLALPVLLYVVKQRQDTRIRAVAATKLLFFPATSSSSPLVKNIGQEFLVDVMLDPGTNLVALAKIEILYDQSKVSLSQNNPLVVNTVSFPDTIEGPVYSSGKVQIVVSVGSDYTNVIQTQTKVMTLNFKANNPTDSSLISYGTNIKISSIGPQDASNENVLSTTAPLTIKINPSPTSVPTSTPVPTRVPTSTPTPSPTPSPTPRPNPSISVSPTTVAAGGTVSVTVRNGPGNIFDWVGLYRAGDSEFDYLDWQYLNGEQFPPSSGLSSANLSFTMPHDAGQYEFRFLEDDGFNLLATSQIVTVNPSPTSPPGPETILNFSSVKLHGIGSGGDNPNPNSQGTQNPLRPTRNLNVEIYNTSGALITSIPGSITYNGPDLGNFSGSVEVPDSVPEGSYVLKLKSPFYLKRQLPGFIDLSIGQTNEVVQTSLVAGDINNDNKLSSLDYDILIGCYSDLLPAKDCDDERKVEADITDEGIVNYDDYNLFLRELSVQNGQ